MAGHDERATTKNLQHWAGCILATSIIADHEVARKSLPNVSLCDGLSPNSFGLVMATGSLFSEGAAWVRIIWSVILTGNTAIFVERLLFRAFPGLQSMSLHSTLPWPGVDSAGTGMDRLGIPQRVESSAETRSERLGPTFWQGRRNFLRFKHRTRRTRVEEPAIAYASTGVPKDCA